MSKKRTTDHALDVDADYEIPDGREPGLRELAGLRKYLRENGLVVLRQSGGKEYGEFKIAREQQRLFVYGDVIYERERDHNRSPPIGRGYWKTIADDLKSRVGRLV